LRFMLVLTKLSITSFRNPEKKNLPSLMLTLKCGQPLIMWFFTGFIPPSLLISLPLLWKKDPLRWLLATVG
jgi:hypothetical protein